MLSQSQLALAVGHADVAAHMAFHSTTRYLHTGNIDNRFWEHVLKLSEVTEPLAVEDHSFVLVEGNVLADVVLAESVTLIINGNVRASIRTSNHCEVVIAGDVEEHLVMETNGIFHLFVGGDLKGTLRNQTSCKAWVEGNLTGPVWTGKPTCELFVLGDCAATIKPTINPALLFLMVKGFMPYELLESAGAVGYTQFNASIGKSDRPAGLYPDKITYDALAQHRSFNRWVILDEVPQ